MVTDEELDELGPTEVHLRFSMPAAAILAAICLFGILIWQLIGLLPALSYFSNVNAVLADAWVAVAIKSIIAAVCYFLGSYLFKKSALWWSGAASPLAQDFRQSTELISTVGSAISGSVSEIKRLVDKAIDSTNQRSTASTTQKATLLGGNKADLLRKPCRNVGVRRRLRWSLFVTTQTAEPCWANPNNSFKTIRLRGTS